MILRVLAILISIGSQCATAVAQERVTVATTRQIGNGALFIAAARGGFKAAGLDIQMGAYPTAQAVAEAVASGRAAFGLAALTPVAFNLAGQGRLKLIAAQLREKQGHEGDEVVVSNAAYSKGVRKFEDLAGKVVAIDARGGTLHYQFAQIARVKGFDLDAMALKAFAHFDAASKAVAAGEADAAILPARYARDLIVANQAKLIGWVSEIDEQQTGALFTSPAMIEKQRATVEKFVHAYAGGAANYAAALLRHDRYGKRISNAASQEAARIIASYVFPGQPSAKAIVEATAPFMDAKARIDVADIERQIGWYKAQGFVDKAVDARAVIDPSFTGGH
jgi:NitT/TauT family transport system substrate-binding protein